VENDWESIYSEFTKGYQNPIWYLIVIEGFVLSLIGKNGTLKTLVFWLFLFSAITIWMIFSSLNTWGATPFTIELENAILIELLGITLVISSTILSSNVAKKGL
jgi:hypothetical protein